jgi:hypothetical protein
MWIREMESGARFKLTEAWHLVDDQFALDELWS